MTVSVLTSERRELLAGSGRPLARVGGARDE